MQNLYDFLRRVLTDAQRQLPNTAPLGNDGARLVRITDDDIEWLTQYMRGPDVELHFKAKIVGGTPEDPLMAQDYAIKGEGVDVFSLVTEAMLANPHWANLVLLAANFFKDHVPECTDCRQALINAREKQAITWNFTPHKTE